MAVTFLAGNRAVGTSAERLSTFTLNPSGWVQLARTTLENPSDTILVPSLANKRYYMVLCDLRQTGSNIRSATRFNSDSNPNYAVRHSEHGGSDSTEISQTFIKNSGSNLFDGFNVQHIANFPTREKLQISQYVGRVNAGAGSAPTRHECYGKWANTINPISSIQQYNDQAGDFGSGSEVVVLGYDPADTHTNNFWTELASVQAPSGSAGIDTGTFTAKKYLWIQAFIKSTGGSMSSVFGNFNNDVGVNYAFTLSDNGGGELTIGSRTELVLVNDGTLATNETAFINFFIMNVSSRDKLLIGHSVKQNTAGAGYAPNRREIVQKWANNGQITSFQLGKGGTGTFDAVSQIKVWGSD